MPTSAQPKLVKLSAGRYRLGRYELCRVMRGKWEVWMDNAVVDWEPTLAEAVENARREMKLEGDAEPAPSA